MIKSLKRYGLLSTALLCMHCSQPDSDQDLPDELLKKALADSATASSAPVQDEEPLQQKVELALAATGNTLEDIAYSKDTLEVRAGALVKLTFVNEGVDMPMVHNVVFTLPGAFKQVALAGSRIGASGNYVPNDSTVIAASPMALPGQTVEMEFTAPLKPAAYNFVCTYPDHWQKMHGILLVK
ncbi:plastocyanin/azurin family copper-binding protein [Pontibacter sp. CAU 1760]